MILSNQVNVSLHITETESQAVWWHCNAGCQVLFGGACDHVIRYPSYLLIAGLSKVCVHIQYICDAINYLNVRVIYFVHIKSAGLLSLVALFYTPLLFFNLTFI